MRRTVRVISQTALALLVVSLVSVPVEAQRLVSVRTSTLFETYSYDTGLPFDGITQISTPVAITAEFGRLGTLAVSTGYTSVSLNVTDANLGDQDLSGVIDTDVRWTVEVVPGRLYAIARGTIPTGINRVSSDELSILGVLASDIVGFASPALGSGGNVGGGFVAAVPVGTWALGVGGTYRAPFGYRPIRQNRGYLSPGSEIRLRTGLEGALDNRTYVRIAGVFASRQNDRFRGSTQAVGNRVIGYVSVNRGFGNMTATGYVFDVFRADPQATANAELPRGNLMALGTRLNFALNPNTSVIPNLEYRVSHLARSLTSNRLRFAGASWRGGASVRHRLSGTFGVVGQVSYLTGKIRQNGTVGMSGFAGGLHLEWNP